MTGAAAIPDRSEELVAYGAIRPRGLRAEGCAFDRVQRRFNLRARRRIHRGERRQPETKPWPDGFYGTAPYRPKQLPI